MTVSETDGKAGQLDWPSWAKRTPTDERRRTSKYSVSLSSAIDDIETDLEARMDVDDWRLSTAAPMRQDDGRPYANADPDDPGAVVRWSEGGEQYCICCDHWTRLRDNVRTIGLYITEKRKMADRPVQTGQDEFASARLPPAGDDLVAVGPGETHLENPADILEVAPDASEPVIRAAYSERVKEAHPDLGGSREEMESVRQAREQLLSQNHDSQ